MAFMASKTHPVCGHISEVYKKLQSQKDPNETVCISTPFGFVKCSYNEIAKRWSVRTGQYCLDIPDNKQKASIHSCMPLSGYSHKYVPWGVFRNPNYKFRKNRKSKAICPGLDLRPLQQEYRRKLGDLHRFKHALQQIKALYPRVFWDSFDHAPDYFSIKAMEKYLKDNYAYDKQRMIDAHERGKK